MDWQKKGENTLENLPTRERRRDVRFREGGDYYSHAPLPYAKLTRWLESKAGKHVDSVFHDFVGLAWLLPQHRNYDQFTKMVEVNTYFNIRGEHCYRSKYCTVENRVQDHYRKLLYVHPKTRVLTLFIPQPAKSASVKRRELKREIMRILGDYHQLWKQEGIWHEVKAEVLQPYWDARLEKMVEPYGDQKDPRDPLLEKAWGYGFSRTKKPIVKVVLNRQISKKELKKYGLKNDAPLLNAKVCPSCGGSKGTCIHMLREKWEQEKKW
jgi:hypothetical protein